MNHSRAAQLVSCDLPTWVSYLRTLPSSKVCALSDELEAMLRHPATRQWLAWRSAATVRILFAEQELDRRFATIWRHPDNGPLAVRLNDIYFDLA
jgi:hypothetical protein